VKNIEATLRKVGTQPTTGSNKKKRNRK
jgi:hypothetical protein